MRKPFAQAFVVTLIAVIVAAVLTSRSFKGTSQPAPVMKQASQLKGIGIMLIDYAREHDGVLPIRLEEAIKPRDPEMRVLFFKNPESGENQSWNFHGTGKVLADLAPDSVMVSSPTFRDRGTNVTIRLMANGELDIVRE